MGPPTWSPGGDGGPRRRGAAARAVVGQDGHVVAGAGPEARHARCRARPRCPDAVSRRLSLMLPPVPDLEGGETG